MLAERYDAELLLVQVIAPGAPLGPGQGAATAMDADVAERSLAAFAEDMAGARGKAMVVVDADAAATLCRVAQDASVDTLVVGNAGMHGRKKFLLGNIPTASLTTLHAT